MSRQRQSSVEEITLGLLTSLSTGTGGGGKVDMSSRRPNAFSFPRFVLAFFPMVKVLVTMKLQSEFVAADVNVRQFERSCVMSNDKNKNGRSSSESRMLCICFFVNLRDSIDGLERV